MKRAFISVKVLIALIIAAVCILFVIPRFLHNSADFDRQDAVYVGTAKKLAMIKYEHKKSHNETEVFYYDAVNSRILDASDRRDVDKLPNIVGYGTSPSLDVSGFRSGAVGLPRNSLLKIEMNQKAEITGMFWVKEALPYTGDHK